MERIVESTETNKNISMKSVRTSLETRVILYNLKNNL